MNRIHRKIVVVAAVAGLTWLAGRQSEEAAAFALTGQSWATATATYLVNPSFVDASAGDAGDQIAALQRSASEWKSAGQIPFEFAYGGTTSVATVAPNDGTNAVFYSAGVDGGGALATATWSFFSNGDMAGFDIQFFDTTASIDVVWALSPTLTQYDIESVAVHEFGHVIGMAHSDQANATMFPSVASGTTAPRTLDADDIAGVQSIYGTAATGIPSASNVAPFHAHISGGDRIVFTGADFAGGDPQTITFDGVAATDVTVVDSSRIECDMPAGLRPGWVDVSISHAQGSVDLTNGFFNTALEAIQPLSISAPAQVRMTFPSDAAQSYYAFVAYGFQAGVPLSQVGDPSDTRVVPINDDELLRAVLDNQFTNEFVNMSGTLDIFGQADFQVILPNMPSFVGYYLCFTAVSLDQAALSGVENIAEADVYVIQP